MLVLWATLTLALTGCGEKGDKAILYAAGLGREAGDVSAGPGQLRVAVQNSFTREAVVICEGAAGHYEITVRPTRERYMIIPAGEYEFSAYSYGKSLGNTQLRVVPENLATSKGFLVQIRP